MITVVLVLLGLCLGSFVNALVWRIHEQSKPKSRRAANLRELSIATGRSMCPNCKHSLSMLDLFPVISWVSLGGKCRYCKDAISWQYPLVEAVTAILFVISYIVWPYGFSAEALVLFIAWLITLTGFMALIVYDLRWMLLPDRIVFPLVYLWVGVTIVITVITSDFAYVTGTVLGILSCAGVLWALFQLSDGKWIGGGDVKLALVLGMLVASPLKAILVIFLASYIGTLAALPFIIKKRSFKNIQIPFGPPLMLAAAILFLSGDKLAKLLIAG